MANPYVIPKTKSGNPWRIPLAYPEDVVAVNNQMPAQPMNIQGEPGEVVDPDAMAYVSQTQGMPGMNSSYATQNQDNSKRAVTRSTYRSPKEEELLQKIHSGINPGVLKNELGEEQYTQEYVTDASGNPVFDELTQKPRTRRGDPIYDPSLDTVNPEHPAQVEKAGIAEMQQMLRDRMENTPTQANLSPLAALADYLAPGGKALAGYGAFRQGAPTYGQQADTFLKDQDTLQKRQVDLRKGIQQAIKDSKSGTTLEQLALLTGLKTGLTEKDPAGNKPIAPASAARIYTDWAEKTRKDISTVEKAASDFNIGIGLLDENNGLAAGAIPRNLAKLMGAYPISDKDAASLSGNQSLVSRLEQLAGTIKSGTFTPENLREFRTVYLKMAQNARDSRDRILEDRRHQGMQMSSKGWLDQDLVDSTIDSIGSRTAGSFNTSTKSEPEKRAAAQAKLNKPVSSKPKAAPAPSAPKPGAILSPAEWLKQQGGK